MGNILVCTIRADLVETSSDNQLIVTKPQCEVSQTLLPSKCHKVFIFLVHNIFNKQIDRTKHARHHQTSFADCHYRVKNMVHG